MSQSTAYKPTHGGYPGTVEEQQESKPQPETVVRPKSWVCLTCGDRFTGWGNNPCPIPDYEDREVCSDCNAIYVIPARLGMDVKGTLYDTKGREYARFSSEEVSE